MVSKSGFLLLLLLTLSIFISTEVAAREMSSLKIETSNEGMNVKESKAFIPKFPPIRLPPRISVPPGFSRPRGPRVGFGSNSCPSDCCKPGRFGCLQCCSS